MVSPGADSSGDAWARTLYERAIADQWQAGRDVAWDALELERVAAPIRKAMAMAYGHVYYAERFGLGLCGRLVDVTPAGWTRQFAATQVIDEARHVDFFSTLLARLGGEPIAPPGLVALELDMKDVRDEVELLIHSQVIENAAQTFFVEAARRSRSALGSAIRLPGSAGIAQLLQYLIDLVGRDESRHIAFGQRYLAAKLEHIGASERSGLERRAERWCRMFYASFAELGPHVTRLGLPAQEILAQVWATQRKQLLRVGLEIGTFEP